MRFSYVLSSLLVVSSIFIQNDLAAEIIVDFESFSLGSQGYFNGPVAGAVEAPGSYGGTDLVGPIDLNGVGFINRYSQTYGSWSGFAVSNQADTANAGFMNQFSAFPGTGANGSAQFGVAFGYDDLVPTVIDDQPFDRNNADQLRQLPSIYLPANTQAMSVQVTNTTYAALSMRDGDGFAKAFGGASGNDPDFYRLSIFGVDGNGLVLADEIDFALADFSFDNSADDYILADWATLDLTPLAGARSLHFNLSSSDVGDFGMNTPAYFAIDNLTLAAVAAVPEPSNLAYLITSAITGIVIFRKRKSYRAGAANRVGRTVV